MLWHPAKPFNPARSRVFYGWIIVVASTLGFLASIPGQTVGVSVYTDTYIQVLGLERIELTSAYLIGTGLSGFLVSHAGVLFDRLGARPFMVLSSVLFGCSLALISQIDRILSILGLSGFTAASLIMASLAFLGIRLFGQGMVTLGSRSMLAKWWNHRRGLMVAVSGVFISFGFSLAPRILDWEIAWVGWRNSLLLNAALLGIGFASFAWLFFRDNPEECGLQMDNGWKPSKRPENPDTLLTREFTKKEAARTFAFWIITLSLAFHSCFATAYTFHVVDLARSFQVDKQHMLNFFIYGSFLSVAVNIVVGYLTDRIRLRYVIIVFGLSGICWTAGILNLPGTGGQILLVAGMGFGWGVYPVLSNVGYPRYFGRLHLGAISGLAMAWLVWGSAGGPLAFSLTKDYLGGYRTAVLIALFVYLGLAIGGCFSQNPSRKANA